MSGSALSLVSVLGGCVSLVKRSLVDVVLGLVGVVLGLVGVVLGLVGVVLGFVGASAKRSSVGGAWGLTALGGGCLGFVGVQKTNHQNLLIFQHQNPPWWTQTNHRQE